EELDAALPDSALYPRLDLRLHQEIALLSGNRALQGLLEAVAFPLFRAMQEVRAARDLHDMVGSEHTDHLRIIDSILAGDPEAAAATMEAHMRAVESFRIAPWPVPPRPRGSAARSDPLRPDPNPKAIPCVHSSCTDPTTCAASPAPPPTLLPDRSRSPSSGAGSAAPTSPTGAAGSPGPPSCPTPSCWGTR